MHGGMLPRFVQSSNIMEYPNLLVFCNQWAASERKRWAKGMKAKSEKEGQSEPRRGEQPMPG